MQSNDKTEEWYSKTPLFLWTKSVCFCFFFHLLCLCWPLGLPRNTQVTRFQYQKYLNTILSNITKEAINTRIQPHPSRDLYSFHSWVLLLKVRSQKQMLLTAAYLKPWNSTLTPTHWSFSSSFKHQISTQCPNFLWIVTDINKRTSFS